MLLTTSAYCLSRSSAHLILWWASAFSRAVEAARETAIRLSRPEAVNPEASFLLWTSKKAMASP